MRILFAFLIHSGVLASCWHLLCCRTRLFAIFLSVAVSWILVYIRFGTFFMFYSFFNLCIHLAHLLWSFRFHIWLQNSFVLLYPVIDLSLCSTSRFIGLNLISLFCSILLLLLLQLFNFQLYFWLLTILNWEFTQDLAWGKATIICILCIYAFDSSFEWFLPVTLTVPFLSRWAVSQSATCISYCLFCVYCVYCFCVYCLFCVYICPILDHT